MDSLERQLKPRQRWQSMLRCRRRHRKRMQRLAHFMWSSAVRVLNVCKLCWQSIQYQ